MMKPDHILKHALWSMKAEDRMEDVTMFPWRVYHHSAYGSKTAIDAHRTHQDANAAMVAIGQVAESGALFTVEYEGVDK